MSQLFINIVGFNASGKTTVAKKLAGTFELNHVSGDDFRNFVHDHITYFHDTGYLPNDRNQQLNPLVIKYRFDMLWALLDAGQNVIFDGSGTTREQRAKYLDKIKVDYPHVKTVLIQTDVEEPKLLERLAERDKEEKSPRWVEVHHKIRKPNFEPPKAGEADMILHYEQDNYDEIQVEIEKLLEEN